MQYGYTHKNDDKNKLENVYWISVPVKIGDPIRVATWRIVLKHFAIADTVVKGDFRIRIWIAGKRYTHRTSLSKSHLRKVSVGYPPGDGNSVGVADRFP